MVLVGASYDSRLQDVLALAHEKIRALLLRIRCNYALRISFAHHLYSFFSGLP